MQFQETSKYYGKFHNWIKYAPLKTEAATRGVLRKKLFLEISQNSQENTCARISLLIKLQASDQQLY